MQGIDDFVVPAWSAEIIGFLETARGEDVQVSEHLERRALPRIHLAGHRGGHGQGGGHRATERGVIEPRAHDFEGDIGTLERGRVTCTGQSGGRRNLRCTGTYAAIPQQAIDLAPGHIACLTDAREPSEGGEGIAQ